MPDWALATTPPNSEHLASADLTRLGYPHWLFRRRVSRAWRGRVSDNLLPAFPRYVFVPHDQCWRILNDAWRLMGIVCFGESVARVRERDVELLVERCGGSDVLPADAVPELFAHGSRVHVGGTGIISGHDAIYDRVVDGGRLRVFCDMLGRMVPIDVDERDVCEIQSNKQRRKKRRRRPGRRNRSLVNG